MAAKAENVELTQALLKLLVAFVEPSQTSKMELFVSGIKLNYFHKKLHLRYLNGF